ncbi:hypothetical protein GCM10019016_139800 [Streptomyces prasinosporus]|uniref:Transposase n=1 Tax=Streptomyces prasinosporus TaxID=68256 RepID=A0ABP6UHY7_9ACTN
MPSGICAKLDRYPMTRRNLSGRSHAAVKAQLPPLLPPQMPHRSGDWARVYRSATCGMISVRRKVAYRSSKASYSLLRFFGFSASGKTPGSTNTPMVTGMSPR